MAQSREALRNSHSHKLVTEHPDFNYCNSPDGTSEDMRYVFNHKVCIGIQEAVEYVLDLEAAAAQEAAK